MKNLIYQVWMLHVTFASKIQSYHSRQQEEPVILISRLLLCMCNIYSYFEKGCRKKCTWQALKVLSVVLNSLFFKEIWKNGTRDHRHMFAVAKGKQQTYVWQLHCQERRQSYPILPFRVVACTFLPTTFLEIAVCSQLPLDFCKEWMEFTECNLIMHICTVYHSWSDHACFHHLHKCISWNLHKPQR